MSDPITPTPETPAYDPSPEITPFAPDESPPSAPSDPGEWRPYDQSPLIRAQMRY